jgi:alpha-amylase
MKKIIVILLFLSFTSVHAQETAPTTHWWNERVFYEIFVRSFYDSDGDGIGDLQGIIEKLDYLNDGDPATTTDLGITGLWLMPVMESPSYHGYDVTDYETINEDYGTNEDFKQLMAEAHAREIAVIVDLVINHTSSQHPWFTLAQNLDSPYSDYYIWSDTNPGYGGPSGQQVWHPFGNRYYYGLFSDQMPDLNYSNPIVNVEMQDITRFWLREMGVDGFRLDAVKHIVEEGENQENTPSTLEWMRGFNDIVHTVKPDMLTVGEIWSGSAIVSKYVPDEVNLAFEFDLATTIIDGVRRRSKDAITSIQRQALELYPPGQYAAFLTNHDQNRVMNAFRDDLGSAKVAATILLTNPGVPFIYYGEEIGMNGEKPDERIRTPMQWTNAPNTAGFSRGAPWEALDPSYETANVAAQTDDPDSLLNHYRSLIHLRSQHPALQVGDMLIVDSSERPIYSFIRHTQDETLLILINLNHREIADYELNLAEGPLSGASSAELLLGDGEITSPTVNANGGFDSYVPLPALPPRSSFIIRLA